MVRSAAVGGEPADAVEQSGEDDDLPGRPHEGGEHQLGPGVGQGHEQEPGAREGVAAQQCRQVSDACHADVERDLEQDEPDGVAGETTPAQ